MINAEDCYIIVDEDSIPIEEYSDLVFESMGEAERYTEDCSEDITIITLADYLSM
jgi:hypothetical protein